MGRATHGNKIHFLRPLVVLVLWLKGTNAVNILKASGETPPPQTDL